jgi:hypothetical protein
MHAIKLPLILFTRLISTNRYIYFGVLSGIFDTGFPKFRPIVTILGVRTPVQISAGNGLNADNAHKCNGHPTPGSNVPVLHAPMSIRRKGVAVSVNRFC